LKVKQKQKTFKGAGFLFKHMLKTFPVPLKQFASQPNTSRIAFPTWKRFSSLQKSWNELLPRQPVESIIHGLIHVKPPKSIGGSGTGVVSLFEELISASRLPLSFCSSGKCNLSRLTAGSAAVCTQAISSFISWLETAPLLTHLMIQRNGVLK
jgi:hypothetical protein